MKKLCLVSIAVAGMALLVLAQVHAQGRGGGRQGDVGQITGGGDLMEFICLEGNEYGAAAGFTPGTGVGNR